MILNQIEIENFRKFKEKKVFHLKKVNLFVGPNNSGKSAAIKALLLLQENLKTNWQELHFGPDTTHRILSFEHAIHSSGTGNSLTISIDVDSLGRTLYYDGEALIADKLPHRAHLVYKKGTKDDVGILERVTIHDQDGNLITDQINAFQKLLNGSGYLPVIDWAAAIEYAPPYRSIGLKEYPKAKFARFGKSLKENQIAQNMGDEERKQLTEKWLEKFGIGDVHIRETENSFFPEILKGNQKMDLSYLGTGSSQVLGILFLITTSVEQTIILEEPETNLHPDFQSKLADLIADGSGVGFGNQFIIETHSEYLIRRFQYLVAKKEVNPQDIQIFYFHDPSDQAVKFKELNIDPDGNLSGDFGEGFFDHAPYLITELWKAQRN